jgi:tetratricopeptide (TPR) repeat protein
MSESARDGSHGSKSEWKKPEKYVAGPGMPSLPPQLAEYSKLTPDEIVKSLKKLPFFMTEIEDGEEENEQLEALKALAYEGEPHEIALNFKNQGNDWYREKNYKDAIEYYTKALAVQCGVDEIDLACYLNRAACNLELKNYRRCINDCKLGLRISPSNAKALFRSAKAYLAVDRVDECLDCVQYALSIEPANAALKSLEEAALKRRNSVVDMERKRKTALELKETKKKNLDMAVQSRNITKIITDQRSDDRRLYEDLRIALQDDMNAGSALSVPLLFLYPLELESDIFQSSQEDSTIESYLSQLFQSSPPWFDKSPNNVIDYAVGNLQVYVQTTTGGLAKVGLQSSIIKVLSMKSPIIPVIDDVLRLYVVPKNRASEWLSTWDKKQALRLMGLDQ